MRILVKPSCSLYLYLLKTLALIGEFTKKEWDYIMEAVHPVKMWKYVKDELTGNDTDEE